MTVPLIQIAMAHLVLLVLLYHELMQQWQMKNSNFQVKGQANKC